jgi:hypothetical protein
VAKYLKYARKMKFFKILDTAVDNRVSTDNRRILNIWLTGYSFTGPDWRFWQSGYGYWFYLLIGRGGASFYNLGGPN